MKVFYSRIHDNEQSTRESWPECAKRQSTLRRQLVNVEFSKNNYGKDSRETDLFKYVDERWHEAAVRRDFSDVISHEELTMPLTDVGYTSTLRTLLKMEQAYDAINQRRLDMFDQRLKIVYAPDGNGNPDKILYYGIRIEGLSDGRPSLIANDYVILRSPKNTYLILRISEIRGDLVLLPRAEFRKNRTFLSDRVDIFFASCGILYRYYQKALKRFDLDDNLKCIVFPKENEYNYNEYNNERRNSYEESARIQQLNEHQRQAVRSILESTSCPRPYILFGPPGTGKTHTLAEAIGQIYTSKPSVKILYCANSNSCANQMVDKLKNFDFIRPQDVVRLFAGEKIDAIKEKRVILTTNMKSSSVMDRFKFDYVFVDEAAHAHEVETLIPISCLTGNGCLVLAGDPKQLGPVIQCDQAAKYGLGRSMFERIFDFDIYKRDATTGQYNDKYITKLLVSYRCDPRILAISNKLFYDDELVCANETPKSILKMMRISTPMQFHFVDGQENQPKFSTSWRNANEVDRCVDLIIRLYKMGLEPHQIGVITPYKLQAKLIYRKLSERVARMRDFFERRFRQVELVKQAKKAKALADDSDTNAITFDLEKLKLGEGDNLKESEPEEIEYEWVEVIKKRPDKWLCKIDSVDAFQGNEREVIIISTVRTPSSRRTDFINDSRRFNVAISRAKWLVFVIGHKFMLREHSNWNELISNAGHEMSKWPKQSVFDAKYPFKQIGSLFGWK